MSDLSPLLPTNPGPPCETDGSSGTPAFRAAPDPLGPLRRDAGLAEQVLDATLAMSPGGLLYRRCIAPELRLVERDPTRFVVATASHEFSGDLSKGVVLQAARHGDGQLGPAVCHSGNMLEFHLRGRAVSLDVEAHIEDFGIARLPGRVVLRHESRFALRAGILGRSRSIAALRYEYTILADGPVLHLTVTLLPEPSVRLVRPRVTTALDDVSPEDRPGVTRALVWTEGGKTGTALRSAGLVTLHEGPARHAAFPEDGPRQHAVSRHLRLCDGGRLVSVKGTARGNGRLHWVVLRYGAAALSPGECLAIREERLLSVGDELDDTSVAMSVPSDAMLSRVAAATGRVPPRGPGFRDRRASARRSRTRRTC